MQSHTVLRCLAAPAMHGLSSESEINLSSSIDVSTTLCTCEKRPLMTLGSCLQPERMTPCGDNIDRLNGQEVTP